MKGQFFQIEQGCGYAALIIPLIGGGAFFFFKVMPTSLEVKEAQNTIF